MFAASKTKGVSAVAANYIEDVYSTFLYTGTGSTQTITNEIDLAGKGGLVWLKCRTLSLNHFLYDTTRGATNKLSSNLTNAASVYSGLTSFSSSGFNLGSGLDTNETAIPYASWTFREQPKFFDIVTYTGTGANTTIAHNLGSVPGCIMVKRTDSTGNWQVYHQSLANTEYMVLNTTAAKATGTTRWNSTTPTSTVFSLGTDATVNANGATYVAYLFAHNAGGFGLTGTDNVISCGSFTTDGSGNASVNLGYEPQWILLKKAYGVENWFLSDNMRGASETSYVFLNPNTSAAESGGSVSSNIFIPISTGFKCTGGALSATSTYIYIAIRRGPMKVPTDGTKVFNTVTATGGPPVFTPGFVTDMAWTKVKNSAATGFRWVSRLLSGTYTDSSSTSAEAALAQYSFDYQNGWRNATVTDSTLLSWSFGRAPGFFDEVCYTGNGAASRAVPHNLTVAPELMLVKARNLSQDWYVYNGAKPTFYLTLNTTNSESNGFNLWGGTATATNFYVNNVGSTVNDSGYNFVAYLFATCPGVSKVGSYTGNGSTQTINCGFTGGARLVLIKRTDSTGNWEIFDTARGMVAGTDPHLELNTTNAETNANWVYTTTGGFQVVTSDANVNASGGSYLYLAVA